ncbi:hypothetical protein V8G54_019799, partial [Vigna mungo]
VHSVICTTDNFNTTPWILDSGAIDHVSYSFQFFTSYHNIDPITVKLPNGHHVTATHSGTVQFSSNLTLTYVLYIPSFSINLIFISRLVSTVPCQLIFTADTCLIQDVNTKMKIGSVDVQGGLYKLIPQHTTSHHIHSSIVNPKCNVIPIDIWHFRLGHPSHGRLHVMQQLYPCLTINKNFTCNTCHYTKQRKLPFPLSTSHALHTFSLLHMDIWGSCSTPSLYGHRYFLTIVDDHSHFTWIFLMRSKAKTRMHIINFIIIIENQFNIHV